MVDDPLKSSARRLIGYLDNVREVAVREQQGYLLRVDLDENLIHFYSEKDIGETELAAPTEKNQFSPRGDVRLLSIWKENSDLLTGGVVELWVNRQGYMEKSVVHLENKGHDSISLAINPFQVQIEVHEGIYKPEQDGQ